MPYPSYPDLLLLDLTEESHFRQPIEHIRESEKKAAAIVQDLLTLARRGVTVAEVVNLNDLVDEYLISPACERLRSFLPKVVIETELEPELSNILGLPVHLFQSLMNFVSNAAEAMLDGGQVVALLKKDRVDLLILDMIMEPGIDGLETYRQILEIHPDQKAIITSGYAETDRVKEAKRLGAGSYLRKPYTVEELGRVIKAELNRGQD